MDVFVAGSMDGFTPVLRHRCPARSASLKLRGGLFRSQSVTGSMIDA